MDTLDMKKRHDGLFIGSFYFAVLGYKIERESAHKDYFTVSKKTIFSEGSPKSYKLTMKCIIAEEYMKVAQTLDQQIGRGIRYTFKIKQKLKVANAYMTRYSLSEVFDENMVECELEFMTDNNILEVTT